MKIKIEKLDSRRKQYIKNAINKDKKDLKFCVLGAGHGGLAMAGHLAIMGFNVNLYNRGKRRIRPLSNRMAIKLEGEIQGIGNIALASTNIKECLAGVDILMVSTPANGHRFMANTCAPYLKENQIVILNPGRTGGALEFYHTLKKQGVKKIQMGANTYDIEKGWITVKN